MLGLLNQTSAFGSQFLPLSGWYKQSLLNRTSEFSNEGLAEDEVDWW